MLAQPLVATLAGLLAVGAPVAAAVAGRRAGASVGPALDADPRLALSLVLSLAVAAAGAGALVALASPGRAFLGSHLAAAPLPPAAELGLLVVAPVALVGPGAMLLGFAALGPVLAETSGGTAGLAPLLAAGAAGFAVGGAAAESVLCLARGGAAGAVGLAGSVCLLGAAGAATRSRFGPFQGAADALRGEAGAVRVTAVLLLAVWAALLLWGAVALRRPGPRRGLRTIRPLLPLGSTAATAGALVAAKLLGRRAELRRIVVGVLVLAAGGAALLGRAGVQGDGAFVLAGAALVFGLAAVPASWFALALAWRWLSGPAPSSAAALAAGGAVGALFVAGAELGVSLLLLALVAPAGGTAAAALAGAGALLFACALAVGVHVPWRSDRLVDQLASFALVGALSTAAWIGAGRLVAFVERAGIPRPAVTAALLSFLSAAAVAEVVRASARGAP